jgi:uncharacterized protein YabN with tetrapyrrole methylase and pyrophosphatase domain
MRMRMRMTLSITSISIKKHTLIRDVYDQVFARDVRLTHKMDCRLHKTKTRERMVLLVERYLCTLRKSP